MEYVWICVVLNKNLYIRGLDAATKEMQRLAGDHFIDFKMSEDEFDGECYSFLKCYPDMKMDKFRKSGNVISVLESYDNPAYLSDSEVVGFVEKDEEEIPQTRYGDMVLVLGDGNYAGLHGIITWNGALNSEVLFRLHTVTRREWIKNDELVITGSVFSRIKLPVIGLSRKKYPVVKEDKCVDTGELDRTADRAGK